MIRAFLAVLLDESLRAALHARQDSLKTAISLQESPSVRIQWVRPEALHLTVKFLGDIEEVQVEQIKQAIGPVCAHASTLTVALTHLGVFPDMTAPRVVWVGCRPTPGVTSLVELASSLDRALGPLGFAPERRPFQAHLTLARIKDGARPFGQALARSGALELTMAPMSCPVGRVHLMKSELRPSGAVYTPLCEVPLGGNGAWRH